MKTWRHQRRVSALAATCLAVLSAPNAAAQLDPSWSLTVNGVPAVILEDGRFIVSNIQIPDTSPMDGVGDQFVQLSGMNVVNGVPLYAFSNFFRIRDDELTTVRDVFVTDIPPLRPVELRMTVDRSLLTDIGDPTQLNVIATLRDGSQVNATTEAEFTTYLVSNPNVVTVSNNGEVQAVGMGGASITARNDNVSAVVQVFVSPDDLLTTVEGFVWDEADQPVENALVRLIHVIPAETTTGPDGSFTISGVPALAGPIGVLAFTGDRVGFARQLVPMEAGITDAGIIRLEFECAFVTKGLTGSNQLTLCAEQILGSDPGVDDSDDDRVSDDDEFRFGTNPLDPDTDGDGLSDDEEIELGTNPLMADNTPPTIRLLTPAAGDSLVEGQILRVVVDAQDDGRVARVEFSIDGTLIATDTFSPFALQTPVTMNGDALTLEVTAFDTNDNSASTGTVEFGVIPDPLTVIAGVVTDESGVGLEGVTIRLPGTGLETLSEAGGGFLIADVPTVLPNLVAHARLEQESGPDLIGISLVATPVRRDVTNLGQILLQEVMPPRFPGEKLGTTDTSRNLVIADFNNDLIPDLGGFDDDFLLVFPGTGSGAFGDPVRTEAECPELIAAGDVNLDGNLDIMYSNEEIDESSLVLFGNGDGTFRDPVELTDDDTEGFPENIEFADLNNDGTLDFVAYFGDSVGVRLGSGTGEFDPIEFYATGCCSDSMEIADLTGDMFPDIVVPNEFDQDLSLLVGTGDGSLADEIRLPLGSDVFNPRAVLATDVTFDGVPDLLVSSPGDRLVVMLENLTGGSFAASQPFLQGPRIFTADVADLNGDGTNDIVGGIEDSGAIQAVVLEAPGSLQPGPLTPVGNGPEFVTLGDFNLDGFADAASSVFGFDQFFRDAITVSLGRGGGAFGAETLFADMGFEGPRIGDLTGDGIADLLVTRVSVVGGIRELTLLPGVGDGEFGAPQVVDSESGFPVMSTIAALNADALLDLVYGKTDNQGFDFIAVVLNEGGGVLSAPSLIPLPVGNRVLDLEAVQFDDDGFVDIIALTGDFGISQLSILFGNGDGTFAAPVQVPVTPQGRAFAMGDLNGDAFLDACVVIEGSPSQFALFFGTAESSFELPVFIEEGEQMRDIAVADVTGDGLQDILVTGFELTNFAQAMTVYSGDGAGNFAVSSVHMTGSGDSFIRLADVDGDGLVDAIVNNRDSEDISIFIADGTGSFLDDERYAGGRNTAGHDVGDVNGDGRPDIVVANGIVNSPEIAGSLLLLRNQR